MVASVHLRETTSTTQLNAAPLVTAPDLHLALDRVIQVIHGAIEPSKPTAMAAPAQPRVLTATMVSAYMQITAGIEYALQCDDMLWLH